MQQKAFLLMENERRFRVRPWDTDFNPEGFVGWRMYRLDSRVPNGSSGFRAFEGQLTAREPQTLMREAGKLLDKATNRFTLYPVAAPQERGIGHLGPDRPQVDNPDYYLI